MSFSSIVLLLVCVCIAAIVAESRHEQTIQGPPRRILEDKGNAKPANHTSATPNYFVLAVQQCDEDGNWTIHGLWPQWNSQSWPSWCTSAPFSMSALAPIQSELTQFWPSCQGDPLQEFWAHEWSKHGTCSPWGVYQYFNTALQVFNSGSWQSSCPQVGNECQVHVTP